MSSQTVGQDVTGTQEQVKLEVHEAADMFPLMEGEEFESLVDDIKVNGQKEPVILYKGKLLDGRNRMNACQRIGIRVRTHKIDKEVNEESFDPFAHVASLNLHRRHLGTSQRSLIAADLQIKGSSAAKERQRTGKSADGEAGGRGKKKETDGTDSKANPKSQAATMKVSPKSVSRARKLIESCKSELIEDVRNGRMSLNAALKRIAPPSEPKPAKASGEPAKPVVATAGPPTNVRGALEYWWGEATNDDKEWFRSFIKGKKA